MRKVKEEIGKRRERKKGKRARREKKRKGEETRKWKMEDFSAFRRSKLDGLSTKVGTQRDLREDTKNLEFRQTPQGKVCSYLVYFESKGHIMVWTIW